MIRSMTGFGDASVQVGGVHYFVEVRSLNSKYFKATIRLPEELQALEAEIEAELRRRLSRGSVFMSAKCADTSESAAHVINERALAKYLEQLSRVRPPKGEAPRLDIGALLALPGVLQPPGDEEERLDHAREVMQDLLTRACDALMNMRRREGAQIHEDLMGRHGEITAHLDRISERAPKVVEAFEKRLRTRIESMVAELGIQAEPVDIIREIAVCAERVDISEELSRLRGHIEQFAQMLGEGKERAIGRTLDFIAQEMLREANTIASKCSDSEISRSIVEVKGAIDRIKEQVQNVE